MAKVADKAEGETTTVETGSNSPVSKRSNRGAKPGERRGGRKKGTPNKMSADIKTAILEAFQEAGGAKYLKKVAMENPQVFCTLVGKVLPMQVTGEGGGPLRITWGDSDSDAD